MILPSEHAELAKFAEFPPIDLKFALAMVSTQFIFVHS